MEGLKLKIDNKTEWLKLYYSLWKAGLLRDIPLDKMNLSQEAFPIEVPFDIDGLIDLLSHPLVKPYKKKIDIALHENLNKIIG